MGSRKLTDWAKRSFVLSFAFFGFWAEGQAQIPNHPILTEVYTDPVGVNDGPVGRDPGSLHQEFIEVYVPPAAALAPALNEDALRLTFYEIEGDSDSTGVNLVNYRFDLPVIDMNPGNGVTAGAIAPAQTGDALVLVLGWVDYVGNPPTGLAGTPSTRVALVDGEVTSTPANVKFIAINGHHFQGSPQPGGGGTTNFAVLAAESFIDLPSEASSGIIQNGSGAYLLVNRDLTGYVMLCDDQHAGDCPAGAFPNLPDQGSGLDIGCHHDGYAGNDDANFDVLDQPSSDSNNIDLGETLPPGGAFSLLTCQIPESDGTQPNPGTANGYARRFVDVPRTTETPATDDPVADATTAYRHIRNNGPFFPTPGEVVLTTSPPELGVAASAEQTFQVLYQTTGRPGILAANVGGNYGIDITTSPGTSSNPSVATFGSGTPATGVPGQSFGLPTIAITAGASAAHLGSASATITVNAANSQVGDPAVLSAVQMTTATATVLRPTTGTDVNGQPFQATVFVAAQFVPATATVNEFRATSLGAYLASLPDITTLHTLGNGPALINPATDIGNPLVVQPMVREMPDIGEECTTWRNDPGPPGRLSLAQTVTMSAEVLSGSGTYDESIGFCNSNGQTVIKTIRLNIPDALTFGGTFTPTETVHFANSQGAYGEVRSGLSNATTSRAFELAIVDTNVRLDGTIETARTDDFGVILEVAATEAGAPVIPGEFVFLSWTGSRQGADIDPRHTTENNLAVVYLFDLDNLHDVLGIRSVEAVFLVDSSGGGEVDVIEAFTLPSAAAALVTANPATQHSLWRSHSNIVRLTFGSDITVPTATMISIQRMLPGGAFGSNLSAGFQFTMENDGFGNPRILKIVDVDPPDLVHREWYAIRNVGGWGGVAPFTVQYVTQIGDADEDGAVLNRDASLINAGIPNFNAGDADRRDIDGDGTVLNGDVSVTDPQIPSFVVPKPNGH